MHPRLFRPTSTLFAITAVVAIGGCRGNITSGQRSDDATGAVVPAKVAIVLTGAGARSPFDDALALRLANLGYGTTLRSASAPLDASFARATLVVISPSADATELGRFADLELPIVAISAQSWQALQLVDLRPPAQLDPASLQPQYPSGVAPRTSITALDTAAVEVNGNAGLLADGAMAMPDARYCADGALTEAALAGPEAIPVAWRDATHTSSVAFAFEAGAVTTDDATATRRRVALAGCRSAATQPATELPSELGWKLFDAAAQWADPLRYSGTAVGSDLTLRSDVVILDSLPGYDFAIVRGGSIDVAFKDASFVPTGEQTWVGSAMGGFLRRTVEVAPGPFGASSYHVTTSQASLTDLYRAGSLVLGKARRTTPSSVKGVASSPLPETNVSLTTQLALGDYCSASFIAAVKVAPTIGLNVTPEMSFKFNDDGLDSARITAKAEGRAGLSVTGSADVSASCTATLDKLPSLKFNTVVPIPLGPIVIPLDVVHELRPILNLSISGTLSGGSFVASAAGKAALTAGVEYANGAWSPVWEPTATTELSTTVTKPGTLTATVGGKVTLEYTGKLYGLIGPRVAVIADATGSFAMDPNKCNWTAEGKVKFSAQAGISSSPCSGGMPVDSAKVEQAFNKRFGNLAGKERATALLWYQKGYCAPVISLGRFPEFQQTGLPYLNVVPASDWTFEVNRAWVYGNIDNGGSFVLATDPRIPRARFGDTGVEDPPKSGSYRTTSTCDRRTITADELDLLQREGYRTVLLTPSAAAQASCSCAGSCPVPPLPTLPKVLPPKANFATFLATVQVAFPLFETTPLMTSGALDPTGAILPQCAGKDSCGGVPRPKICASGFVAKPDGTCAADCPQDGQLRGPDGVCVFIGSDTSCSQPGDRCLGGKLCRGQNDGLPGCVCPDGLVWDDVNQACTIDISRSCGSTTVSDGYSRCGTVEFDCVHLKGDDNCGACGHRCPGGQQCLANGGLQCGCPAELPNWDSVRNRCVAGSPSDRSVHPSCPEGYSLIDGNLCTASALRCEQGHWFNPNSPSSCGHYDNMCRPREDCLPFPAPTGQPQVNACGCVQGANFYITQPYTADGYCTD